MNTIMQQLSTFDDYTDLKTIQNCAQQMQLQIQRLEQCQKQFYCILLSEIYAVKIKNIDKAYEILNKISSNREVISHQHKLRLCYYKYLSGEYQEAIKQLKYLKIIMQNSLSCQKIIIDFFKRIMNRNSNTLSILQSTQEQYQRDFIKGIKDYFNYKYDNAIKIFTNIYNKYQELDQSVVYQAAKTLLFILQNSKITIANQQVYKVKVKEFQKKISNKIYYKQKLQYLGIMFQIIEQEENIDEEIKYKIIKQYITESIQQQLKKVKDKTIKKQLSDLLQNIEQNQTLSSQLAFKFIGQKKYRSILAEIKNGKIKGDPAKQLQKSKVKEKNDVKKKFVQSVQQDEKKFKGSMMIKINMNSNGFEERYFYIDKNFKKNKKLFYSYKKEVTQTDDNYYQLRRFKKIQFGKKSKALKRSQCDQFDQDRCFTLKIQGNEDEQDVDRNFYVQNEEDYDNWIRTFLCLIDEKKQSSYKQTKSDLKNVSKMKKTIIL